MINSIVEYLKIIVKSKKVAFLCLVCIGYTIYFPAIFGEFFGDDGGQILNNPFITSLKNIPLLLQSGTFYAGGTLDRPEGSYYRPFMSITYSLIYSVFGLDYRMFHSIHILFHIINTYLVYRLFDYLLKPRSAITFLLSLIFLVHPINGEAVAYLADLQDVLFVFFGLLALHTIIRYQISKKTLIMTLGSIFCSLLSKEVGVLFIIVIYLYLDLLKKHSAKLFLVGSTVIFFLYIILRCVIAGICMIPSNVPISQISALKRMAHVPLIIFTYLKTFFYPHDLAIFQYWLIDAFTVQSFYAPLLVVILFFIGIFSVPVLIYISRKKIDPLILKRWSHTQPPLSRVYVFFLLWFIVGITAHIHIVPLDATVAERWFYFPIIGLVGMIGCLLILIPLNKKWLYTGLTIGIIILSIRSFIRNLDWKDAYRLYSKDITISQRSSTLENNFGVLLEERGQVEEAKKHYERAVKLAPHNPIYLYNLAHYYKKKKNYRRMEEFLEESMKQGRYYVAFEEYGRLLLQQGRTKEAKQFFEKRALKHFPYNNTLKDLYQQTLKLQR